MVLGLVKGRGGQNRQSSEIKKAFSLATQQVAACLWGEEAPEANAGLRLRDGRPASNPEVKAMKRASRWPLVVTFTRLFKLWKRYR